MVKHEIAKLIQDAEKAQGEEDIRIFLLKINAFLNDSPGHIPLLFARAELYTKQQKFSFAINDYKSILSLDKTNKKAAIQIEQLQTILKYQNTDIFESPNTNFDPWLD